MALVLWIFIRPILKIIYIFRVFYIIIVVCSYYVTWIILYLKLKSNFKMNTIKSVSYWSPGKKILSWLGYRILFQLKITIDLVHFVLIVFKLNWAIIDLQFTFENCENTRKAITAFTSALRLESFELCSTFCNYQAT